MGSFADVFAENDIALVNALGDDAIIDIDGDGVKTAQVKGLLSLPLSEPDAGTLRTNLIEMHFTGRTTDLSVAKEGTSILTESGLTYDVVHIPPPADGITVLVLRPRS